MPRYNQNLNDTMLEDMDIGFTGFNNYLRPDQLPRGMLADSQNGRLGRNGEWQVRKGIEVISEPLLAGVDALTLTFTLPTLGQIDDGITAILNDSAVNEVYGSCGFSDPGTDIGQYIVIATNNKAIALKLSESTLTGGASGATYLPFNLPTAPQLGDGITAILYDSAAIEEYGTQFEIDYPAGEVVSGPVSMIQAFNKVFIFRKGEVALEWNGVINDTAAFTKVASGTYSQPEMYYLPMSAVTSVDGLVSFTISGDATAQLPEGKFVRVYEADSSTFSITVDEEYYIVSSVFDATDTIVQARMPVIDHDGTGYGDQFITIGRQISIGNGFTHMPAPKFAVYHQRRLVMPFTYSVDAGVDSYTSRGIQDEVIASDVLDSDTYDQIYANFRFNAGTADYVVGLHSFSDDKLLVFNRNSIHIVIGSAGTAVTQLLTNEVGCVARRTITQVGNSIIFLSDNGVYGTDFQDLYNLRGNDVPISGSINSTISRINRKHWDKSVAIYYGNRYYIAVPIDGSTKNNAILIFNFINKQWESIDTVDDAAWNISNLIISGDELNRGVYAVNDLGGVHRLETRVDSVDRVITAVATPAQTIQSPASVTTRQFTMGVIDRKKWNNYELHVQSSEGNTSDFSISAEIENLDSVVNLGTLSSLNGGPLDIDEDVALRGRIGNKRGYGIQFTLSDVSGRPRFRAIKVSGAETFRSTIKAI